MAHKKTQLDGIQREILFQQPVAAAFEETAQPMRYEEIQLHHLKGPSAETSHGAAEEDEGSSWWYQIFACIGADRSPLQNRTAPAKYSKRNERPPAVEGVVGETPEGGITSTESGDEAKSPSSSPRNSFEFVVDRFGEHEDVADMAARQCYCSKSLHDATRGGANAKV